MALDLFEQVRRLFPFFSAQQARAFTDAWTESGDQELALAEFRQNPNYATWFPGNRRDDGTVRLTEFDYLSTVEGYNQRLAQFDIPPSIILTPERVESLIMDGKSADEFEDELNAVFSGVITRGEEIRSFYAENFGAGDLSDAAIFASAIDRDRSPLELQRRIRVAQIGGEARRFGFTQDVGLSEADRLAEFGLNQESARRLFSEARRDLPSLNDLVSRFNDPDDELTLDDFSDAVVLQDPEQLQRIGRLLSRQQAQFSPGQETVRRDREQQLVGLRPR